MFYDLQYSRPEKKTQFQEGKTARIIQCFFVILSFIFFFRLPIEQNLRRIKCSTSDCPIGWSDLAAIAIFENGH